MPLQEVTNSSSSTATIDTPIKPPAASEFDGAAFVGKIFAAWAAGKMKTREQAQEFYADDYIMDLSYYSGLNKKMWPKKRYEGLDGVVEFMEAVENVMEAKNFDVIGIVNGAPGSNKIYFHHTKEIVIKSTGKSTGVVEAMDIATHRDGKIIRWEGTVLGEGMQRLNDAMATE
jgi:hypothetical protein